MDGWMDCVCVCGGGVPLVSSRMANNKLGFGLSMWVLICTVASECRIAFNVCILTTPLSLASEYTGSLWESQELNPGLPSPRPLL